MKGVAEVSRTGTPAAGGSERVRGGGRGGWRGERGKGREEKGERRGGRRGGREEEGGIQILMHLGPGWRRKAVRRCASFPLLSLSLLQLILFAYLQIVVSHPLVSSRKNKVF